MTTAVTDPVQTQGHACQHTTFNGRHAVRVFNVPLMSFCTDEDPRFSGTGVKCDEAWFQQVIHTFRYRVAKGKAGAHLLLRHNDPFIGPAETIGRLENLRWVEPWLTADVLLTEPKSIEKFLRGELPNSSAELYAESAFLWGLSLIDGQEGHFSEEKPDFLPGSDITDVLEADLSEQLSALSAGKTGEGLQRKTLAVPVPFKPILASGDPPGESIPESAMTPEQIAAIQAENAQLKTKLSAAESNVTKLAADLKAKAGNPEDGKAVDDATTKLAAEIDAMKAKLAKQDHEAAVNAHITALKAGGCHLTVEQLRKLLEPHTIEGMPVIVESLKALPKAPAPEHDPQADGGAGAKGLSALMSEWSAEKRKLAAKHNGDWDAAERELLATKPELAQKIKELSSRKAA